MKAKAKKRWLIAAYVLMGIVFAYLLIASLPRPHNYKLTNPMRVAEGELPILVAHRGGAEEFPGDTLEAFYNAYSVDPNVLMETDVSMTKDGVLILCHDTRLDKTTNVVGHIYDWNYADLLANPNDNGNPVNFGYYNKTDDEVLRPNTERRIYTDWEGKEVKPSDVPGYPAGLPGRDATVYLATTLEDLLKAFPTSRISVEIKQSGEWGKKATDAAMQLLDKYDAWGRVNLASFHDDVFAYFKDQQKAKVAPKEFMYSPSMGGVIKYYAMKLLLVDVFYTDGANILQIPMEKMGFELADKNLIANAHAHNIAVHYWTIDNADDMRTLIEIGADGIMTDRPHLLAQVLAEYAE